jgi:hypothetical protein
VRGLDAAIPGSTSLTAERIAADLFVAVEPYIWGRDTHDGIAYTAGSTWYFDFSKRKP